MSDVKRFESLGQTYDLELNLKCGHNIRRNTHLGEDQTQAAYLYRMLIQKYIDRKKGLPETDFNIVCPECQKITKFTEIQQQTFTVDNNFIEY